VTINQGHSEYGIRKNLRGEDGKSNPFAHVEVIVDEGE
jgi:hypothetical protein